MNIPNRPLHRFAVIVAISTVILIYIGGLVTSTDSGLAVPDWPLSYGQLFPKMVGGVFYEHGHRMVAATVGLLTVILAVWTWYREPRRWVRRIGLLALTAVIVQGLLGGMTVLLLLPAAVSIGHAGTAQIFLCLTVSLAVLTSPGWHRNEPRLDEKRVPRIRLLAVLTTVAIYCQILLGALVRHTNSGLAIPDFPLAFGRLVPPFTSQQVVIQFIHRLGAVAVSVLVLWTVFAVIRRYRDETWIVRPSIALAAALVVQVLLGGQAIWSGLSVVWATLHVAGGAVTLASSVVLTLRVHRLVLAAPALESARLAHAGPGLS